MDCFIRRGGFAMTAFSVSRSLLSAYAKASSDGSQG